LAAGKPGERGDDDRALRRQRVEKREPPRQPAKPGEKAKLWPLPFLPDAARKAVYFDVNGLKIGQDNLVLFGPRAGRPRSFFIPPPAGLRRMTGGPRARLSPSAAATSGPPTRQRRRQAAA